MLDGVPNTLSAEEKIVKINELLKKSGSQKISKELKRKLQNRRSALQSRLRKQSLINGLQGNNSGL